MFIRQLQEPIASLPGVGKSARLGYDALGIRTQGDVLLLSPRSWEDRSIIVPLGSVARNTGENTVVNTFVQVLSQSWFGGRTRGKRTLKVIVRDISGNGDGRLSLLCFGRDFLEKVLVTGRTFYVYAQAAYHMTELQSSQFEVIPMRDDGSPPAEFGAVLPIYPLSGSLSQRIIRRDVAAVLAARSFDDELPPSLMDAYALLPTDRAIRMWHQPSSLEDVKKARQTLAFTELFYLQLVTRRRAVRTDSSTLKSPGEITGSEKRFISLLPFSLTADQETVLKEIRMDLDSSSPMNRMLQGDVGSGKTLVAWISALHVLSHGGQVAFMAPTELLARQHAENAARLLAPAGVRLAFLTGSVKGKERKLILDNLKAGNIDVIIGTHALFSKEVEFRRLRFVIIDEQHRFGVGQRLALMDKAATPDVLLMTATPIPRTLALTVFGDLNVSTIHTMPPGRLPVITHLVSDASRERMYKAVGIEFFRGHQGYFVYPRIDDSGTSDIRDVTNMFEYLSTRVYPGIPSALLHSRIPEQEKMDILERFRRKELMYLVSTSVVEVGIDIPEATCMVVEHADHFGLSALHQLRGRVGRGTLQSYCFLVYGEPLSDDARQRLLVLRESTDGFRIAEQDLLIRGPGEMTGTRQSGFLRLQFADLTTDVEIIVVARKEADAVLQADPAFLSLSHSVIRDVLMHAPPFPEDVIDAS
ncbi:ATP-dependent DNA helicase RecG [Parasphaerochaeta coccoides DSM 17374]|uniref:ATP-dependent DNA helicase RecG n=2 Tax=Parasphaerochaeta TaxID=3062336 RepID=F4GLV4_PARC1|nr:ATP-dependent DNA helicase RecG [Parasphaerochaeta coccoides DSM 17374]